MLDSRTSKLAKPDNRTARNKDVAPVAPISDAANLESRIRERAYQLYEGRGHEPGNDKQDWAQAEHEILNQRP
jgi:hypothetical protein